MAALYVVFILAMFIVAFAIAAFIWATRNGQFDDLDTPAVRVLFDEDDSALPSENKAINVEREKESGG